MSNSENLNLVDLSKSNAIYRKLVKGRVQEWIEVYNLDRDKGLTSLIALIFRACKCPFDVTFALPKDCEWDDAVQKLEDHMDNYDQGASAVINEDDKKGSPFLKNLCDFIVNILLESQHDIFQDGYFSPMLFTLLGHLSQSCFYDFRHASTMIALKVTTVLSNIIRTMINQLSRCQRQLTVEQNKILMNRSSERIENLETSFSTLDSESNTMDEQIIFLTKRVISNRFRDVSTSIRWMCFAELEIWLHDFTKAFLKPQYLECLRQGLCDPNATIRKKSLQIVKWIYLTCDFVEMEAFTHAIQGSIMELSLDRLPAVSSLAIQVASAVVGQREELLEEAGKGFIQHLVYSPSWHVSHEAGKVLHNSIMSNLKGANALHPSFLILYLLQLKDFILKSNGTEKVALLVKSILSCKKNYLLHWKSYTDILLFEEHEMDGYHPLKGLTSDEKLSLTVAEEDIVISLMVNCMRQIFADFRPRQEKEIKSQQIFKTPREKEVESINATKHFLSTLPKLIKKFTQDKSKIIILLSLCSEINIGDCIRNEDIKALGDVLVKLPEEHVDLQIHLTCAKALAHLCEGNSTSAGYCKLYVQQPFLENTSSNWKDSLNNYVDMCSKEEIYGMREMLEEKEKLISSANNNSSILWAVSCHFSLEEFVDWDELCELSKGTFRESYEVPCEVIKNSFKIILAIILREATEGRIEDDLFKTRVEQFCMIGQNIMKTNPECSVTFSAYLCLSEAMHMLSNLITSSQSKLRDCWGVGTMAMVDYFSGVVCKKGMLGKLSGENKKDVIATYCSLIHRRILPLQAVVYLLKNHNKEMIVHHINIIKETMTIVQSWGMKDFAVAVHDSLVCGYEELLNCEEADNSQKYTIFLELKEIAIHLMTLYGSELGKHREAALKLHCNGIEYTMEIREDFTHPLPNIHFASILQVFCPVVHPSDRKKLMVYLDQQLKALKTRLPMELMENLDPIEEYASNLSSKKEPMQKKRKTISHKSRRNLQAELEAESCMDYDRE